MTTFATLPKPKFGENCNGCGYCCVTEPCQLAQEFLKCHTGPCLALESRDGRTICGLARNPIGYLFKATHPEADSSCLTESLDHPEAHKLSTDITNALGIGKGCDSEDDEDSEAWNLKFNR